MNSIVNALKQGSKIIYVAVGEVVADDISQRMLNGVAEIERLSCEVERLEIRHKGDVEVVKASEACARKHQERADLLLCEGSPMIKVFEFDAMIGVEADSKEARQSFISCLHVITNK